MARLPAMILVDAKLEERAHSGQPVRVAMIGAGFMGRGIALQIERAVPGMELSAIVCRTPEHAEAAYREAGVERIRAVSSAAGVEACLEQGVRAVTDDWTAVCDAARIDAILEVTGSVEHGAHVAARAIERGKHLVLMNAELDGTIGPLLKRRADRAGVVYTNADGDQPGVTMNLFRFVRGIGAEAVLCGNIKGLHDPYRNPTTQEGFARRWGQNAYMVTSFADGTKISFEQAIVANATGFRVARRGMLGPVVEAGTPITEAARWYPLESLEGQAGIVDYVVGASPAPGVFVLARHDDPRQRHFLNLYKLGEGPLYCFYTPYHLCHFEVPLTVARAVLFHDATIAPRGAPAVDVVATAKTDLAAGTVLDPLGGYTTYGLCENYETARREQLLPIGLAEGCRLKRAVRRDEVLTYDDVTLPPDRVSVELRREMERLFPAERQEA